MTTTTGYSRISAGYLLVTAAFCGGAVMVVEFVGARMLSVAYGSTLTVWSAMISVTMLSLACGYFLGGLLADRRPAAPLLFSIIMICGFLTLLCPAAGFILGRCYDLMGLRWGALVSSLTIFFIPLGLLGMVSPFVIRLLSNFEKGIGVTSGGVYALSTTGSVVGTLLVGLWLIPSFGVTSCFRGTGLALMTCGTAGLLVFRCWKATPLLLMALIIPLVPVPGIEVGQKFVTADGEQAKVLDVISSPYGKIVVMSKGGYRLLVVNGIVQSGLPANLAVTKCGPLLDGYYQELLAYMSDDPATADVLVIGLAGGMTAAALSQYGMQIDAVDLDPVMIEAAREWFGYSGQARVADGRRFLEDCRKSYDFCVIDTYSGDSMPFHLASREAFAAAKGVLNPRGILAVNYIGTPTGRAFNSVCKTLGSCFQNILAVRTEDTDRVQTITIFVSDGEIYPNRGWLDHLPPFHGVDPITDALDRLTVTPDLSQALLLTDDYNPIDALRSEEALLWRKRTMQSLGNQLLF